MTLSEDDTWFANPAPRVWPAPAVHPMAFHRTLPAYAPTPLLDAPSFADAWGVGRVLVKDESARFDLGAFKILGASWAIFRALGDASGYDGPPSLNGLRMHLTPDAGAAPAFTLVAATDGNHGRAVARMARLLSLPAAVFMPAEVHPPVIERVINEGANLTLVDAPYDGVVEAARAYAGGALGRVIVQDTAWDGYEDIPNWIAEGYVTLTDEIDAQVAALGLPGVDLIAAPIGVGALAQTVVERHRSGERPACVLGVEPVGAACVLRSLQRGEPTTVESGGTIANGLDCGTPSPVAWPWMRDGLSAAVAVTDDDLRQAMRELRAVGVASGPSGSASWAGLSAALTVPERREALGVGSDATVVALSTEGPIPGVE